VTDKIVVGVDLGGTIVRAGAFDAQGTMLAARETPIEAARGPEAGLRKMQGLIEQVSAESKAKSLVGIGIGASGPVDPIRGTINNPFTLPTWEDVRVVDWMIKAFDVPITLENDADVAALGEYWKGAGQSVQRLYAITLGTGIGTALILDGEIYRGVDGSHPDGGHHLIDPLGPPCYCGLHGCWESLASGTAIAREARQRLKDFPESSLWLNSGGDESRIDAQMVTDAARQGDPLATSVMGKISHYFGLGLANIVLLFTPDMIVLGGSVMKSVDLFLPAIKNTVQEIDVMVPASRILIVPAKLGNLAGMYGAAYTVIKKWNAGVMN